MAILMQCTCGQQMMTADEHAGMKVQCPNCRGIVLVPGSRRAPVAYPVATQNLKPPDEEVDDYPPRRKGGVSKREGLRRARIGLTLHWGKALCFAIQASSQLLMLLFILLLSIAALFSSDNPRARAPGGATAGAVVLFTVGLMSCVGLLASLLMPILSCVGSLLCFWLPARSRARVLSMVAFGFDAGAISCWVLAVMLSLVSGMLNRAGPAGLGSALAQAGLATLLFVLMLVLFLGGWITHMLMLNKLALFVDDKTVAENVMFMLFMGLVTLLAPAFFIGLLLAVGAPGVLVFTFLTLWACGVVALAFKLVNLTSAIQRLL
jgi:hypothetical protein